MEDMLVPVTGAARSTVRRDQAPPAQRPPLDTGFALEIARKQASGLVRPSRCPLSQPPHERMWVGDPALARMEGCQATPRLALRSDARRPAQCRLGADSPSPAYGFQL